MVLSSAAVAKYGSVGCVASPYPTAFRSCKLQVSTTQVSPKRFGPSSYLNAIVVALRDNLQGSAREGAAVEAEQHHVGRRSADGEGGCALAVGERARERRQRQHLYEQPSDLSLR